MRTDLGAGTEAGGVGHPHHASHVGGGEPALLVVVGAGELPPVLLQQTRHTVIVTCNILLPPRITRHIDACVYRYLPIILNHFHDCYSC